MNACWDYYGYSSLTDYGYATKSGPQMMATYDLLAKLSEGTLEMKPSPIFGPSEMESMDQCLKCMEDPQKWVCSVDGVAWCCETGDNHPNCFCYGNSVEDLMYCKSDPAKCGTTDISFAQNAAENLTIIAPTYNEICTYRVDSDYDGVVDIEGGTAITVVDPDSMVFECLNVPCNTTVSVYNDNQVFVISQYGTPNFTAKYTPGETASLSKGIQAWLFITYICLSGAIVIFFFLATWICCKLRKARMSSSRSYGRKQEGAESMLAT